jgi:hypothetical protein
LPNARNQVSAVAPHTLALGTLAHPAPDAGLVIVDSAYAPPPPPFSKTPVYLPPCDPGPIALATKLVTPDGT